MSLPFVSLDSASTPGLGVARDLEDVVARHTMVAKIEGSNSDQCTITLHGSHDGVSWFIVALLNVTLSESLPSGSIRVVTSDEHLVRHVRAELAIPAGSPSVTATIASEV